MRLRRQIGVDLHPFELVPRTPRGCYRVHAIIRQIWATEAALIDDLRDLNDDLEKRAASLRK